MTTLKAPFPYMGGKSRIACEVWRRFGDVPNFVEPFFGSGAILLGRPSFDGNRIETVNDLDGHLANFWRALRADPDAVAYHADWPVSELDLHARGDWLYYRPNAREWVEQLRADPEFYDAKSAGWWAWFVSCWIGALPQIHGRNQAGTPETGVYELVPHLGDAGKGVARKRPNIGAPGGGTSYGSGVNRVEFWSNRRAHLTAYLRQLATRLERVRVCCGDWTRVTGKSVTWKHGMTAVFLDPPYSHAERDKQLYSHDNDVAADVRQWAIENGDNPQLRIALCGYDTEHGDAMPDTWSVWRWKAAGGYGSQGNGRGRDNAGRECVWFSPACINPMETLPLFRQVAV